MPEAVAIRLSNSNRALRRVNGGSKHDSLKVGHFIIFRRYHSCENCPGESSRATCVRLIQTSMLGSAPDKWRE